MSVDPLAVEEGRGVMRAVQATTFTIAAAATVIGVVGEGTAENTWNLAISWLMPVTVTEAARRKPMRGSSSSGYRSCLGQLRTASAGRLGQSTSLRGQPCWCISGSWRESPPR